MEHEDKKLINKLNYHNQWLDENESSSAVVLPTDEQLSKIQPAKAEIRVVESLKATAESHLQRLLSLNECLEKLRF